MARRAGPRPVLSPAGDAREDQPRVDRRAVVRTDTESLAGAGPKAVQQHVGLGDQLQQLLRIGFDVQIHDPLSAVQQVEVLGRHDQSAGAANPHHVGAEIREHHRRVRARPDAAEFDDFYARKWPGGGHQRNVTSDFGSERSHGFGLIRYVQPMASRFDPRGLVDLAEQTVRTYIKAASWSERQIFGLIRSGMKITDPPATTQTVDPPPPQVEAPEGLDAKMRGLLGRAVEQSSTSSRQELFHKILDQIVPDEARIVSALSDGSASPLLNVYARTRAGLVGEVVLENMSLIGKTANLALPHLTPMYVSHLLSLGLVESGPEDTSMKDEYEILAADTAVLQAIKDASRGPIPAPVERYTLRLSGLGLELWAATNSSRDRE